MGVFLARGRVETAADWPAAVAIIPLETDKAA